MVDFDFRGARGSGQGDDFHELWALRHALELLLSDCPYAAMTVEGLRPEDEQGNPADTWDGVDCCFYRGGATLADATGITIDQLKHSGSDPDTNWTISRLTNSTTKTKYNSVIRKLATAFHAIDATRPDLLDNAALSVRLISNQPVSPIILEALVGVDTRKAQLEKLKVASGLTSAQFGRFRRALDLSQCGKTSLMALEENAIKTIAAWTDDNAITIIPTLLSNIRKLMRPDTKRQFIYRELVLAWFGYADPAALFPCPPALRVPRQFIPRDETKKLADKLLSGRQFVCLHGPGGCGKTTVLQELPSHLPPNSLVVIYDCYGAGKYLNSDGYRHRTRDAFMQLANEVAAQGRMPYFLARNEPDYPRAFMRRLRSAAEIIAAENPAAILVIAIDAADNAVIAAKQINENDKCFVPPFVNLGDIPDNVRFIVAARTGSELNLPAKYEKLPLAGFGPKETALHARLALPAATDAWVEDLHKLSKGNPRVQVYALDYGKGDPDKTLSYLRPGGKALTDVFTGQLQLSLEKSGQAHELETICAGLIELPRPVPIDDLSAVTALNADHVRDVCADLEPALRLENNLISFADEDFEDFIRQRRRASPAHASTAKAPTILRTAL